MLQPKKDKLKPRAIDSNVVQKDGIVSNSNRLDMKKDLDLDQFKKETADKRELVSTGNIKKPKSLYFQDRPKNNNAMLSQETRSKEESNMAAEKARKASESGMKNALPLIYLNNPTKAIGDVLSSVGANKSMNFDTSEKDRQELAFNRENPYKSDNEKLKYSLKKGAELIPGAALNLAVAGEGSGVKGALKSFNNVVNPFAGTGILSTKITKPTVGETVFAQEVREKLNNQKYYLRDFRKEFNDNIRRGEYNPKNILYQKIESPLKNDITHSRMFDLNPKEAISYARNRLQSTRPGRRFGEKSLSSDSFPLSMKLLERNKDDFKIIDTGSFNIMNNHGKKYKARLLERSPEAVGNATEYATKKTLEDFNEKIAQLSAATGQKINKAKMIDGKIHVPNIIAERNGGIEQRLLRYKKPAQFAGAVGAGVALTKGLINSNRRVKELERKRDSIQDAIKNSPEQRKLDSLMVISDREDSIGEANWKKQQEVERSLKQARNRRP